MKSITSFKPVKFVTRIGRHHFAHLRAVAEGVDVLTSAVLYLGVEHGRQAVSANRQTVEAVRAVARRHNEGSAWRLIGLVIRPKKTDLSDRPQSPLKSTAKAHIPPLEDFIAERDLDGWGEQEVLQMYQEAYPVDNAVGNATGKSEVSSAAKRERLRLKQLQLLARLEALAVEIPAPEHSVVGWFDDVTAARFIGAGFVNMGLLSTAIQRGGRWYRSLPGIGKGKAGRIVTFLSSIMPEDIQEKPPAFVLIEQPGVYTPFRMVDSGQTSHEVLDKVSDKVVGKVSETNRAASILSADTDMEAIHAWVAARAGSKQTVKVYLREAMRLILWLQKERPGKSLSTMTVEDCLDYMAFLQNIPEHWISRRRAEPFASGWAPFRGQLSHDSHKQSVIIVSALAQWLHAAGYMKANPWVLLNKKTGDDKTRVVKQSKAFSEFGFSEVIRYIDEQAPSLASERMRFIFKFVESVGLRSTELLDARLAHFERQPEGLVLYVSGKGSKNRYVFIPGQALEALQRFLGFRQLPGLEHADPQTPLVPSTTEPLMPVGYQAFYESVKSWTLRAIRASDLPAKERLYLETASPHWLRHTFGARSVARDVAMDAIQAQMGHASIQTTMDIYGRAPMKRRAEEIAKAFG